MTDEQKVIRARTAAAARWGDRGGDSARIRVDRESAEALAESVPEIERRAVASSAIRAAVENYNLRHGGAN